MTAPEAAAPAPGQAALKLAFENWFGGEGYDDQGRFDMDEMEFAFEAGAEAQRDLAAAAAQPAPGGTHVGRSWDGHDLEDECPCPKAPCGLVVQETAAPECDEHPLSARRTIRQSHRAGQCPAQQPAPMCPGGCGCRLGTDDYDKRECTCHNVCTDGVDWEPDEAAQPAPELAAAMAESRRYREALERVRAIILEGANSTEGSRLRRSRAVIRAALEGK